MNRRDFFSVAVGGVSFSLAARAQAAMPVIGFLNGGSPEGYAPMLDAVREGLKEAGYIERENVAIEFGWAEGKYDRLKELASEMVRRRVDVIAATSTPAALATKAATSTIPIVFTTGADPVKLGLVASLNRPGGNVTGVSFLVNELASKQLEMLRTLARPSLLCSAFSLIPRWLMPKARL